jgi:hypothetical protein
MLVDLLRSRIILCMDKKLEHLKDLISTYITKSFVGPTGEYVSTEAIASQMTNEISACARTDSRGQSYAPDQYTLSLNPQDFDDLRENAPTAQTELSEAILKALDATGYLYIRNPNVTLATDPTLPRQDVRVIAWHSSDPLQFSKEMNDEDVDKLSNPPPGAFFIIEGKRYFSLRRKIVKIGRRLDNHLILEDRHVSRSHARLEVVDGRYVIIDLDSTAGTRVNGRLTSRHTLRPGDIVSIAAVQLIYGEDPGGPPEDTSRYKPSPTADEDRDQVTPLNLFLSLGNPTAPYKKE